MKTIRSRWALPLLASLSLTLWASPGASQPKKPPPTAAQVAADAEGLKLVREAGDLERRKKYTDAIAIAEKALAVREKALGADHSSVITTVRFLGELWEKKGDHSRAVPLYERVLAAREKDKGPESIEAAFAIEDVARALTRSGDHTRAITLYQRALALHEKRTPKGEMVGLTLSLIGKALFAKGDLDGAEVAFTKAIAIFEAQGRPTAPIIGYTRTSLGMVFTRKRQYVKAEQEFQQALEIQEKAWGAQHGLVAEALTKLGILYFIMGYFGRAEPLFERAMSITAHESGPDSTDVALAMGRLAENAAELGDYSRAEGLYLNALSIQEKKLPPGHVEAAMTRLGLGKLHMSIGDVNGAAPLIEGAITVMQKELRKDSPALADALSAVAELRFMRGDPEGAEGWLTRALAVDAAHLGSDDPKIALYQSRLGRYAEARGKLADAERLFRQALSAREKVLGAEHPLVATSLRELAALKLRQGDGAAAEPLYQRALGVAEKAIGKDHLDVATALSGLAAISLARRDVAATVAHQSRATDVEEHNLGLILEVGAEAQKRSFMATLAGSTHFTVSLHAKSAPKDAAAQRLSLLTILQRKGRVLDVMADALAIFRRRLPEAERPLLTQLAATRGAYASAALRGPGVAPLDVHRESLSRLAEDIRRLEAKMSSKSATFLNQETPVTLERVQAALPEDAALVEYFLFQPASTSVGDPNLRSPSTEPPRLVAYTLRASGQIRFTDLGPAAAVEVAVAQLRKSLSTTSSTDTRARARALDELVMRPVRGILDGATRVLLSPDGALNLIPFDALVDEQGRYLIERFDFTYLTSGRDLLRRSLRSPARSEPLVFANPAFGRAAGESKPPPGQRSKRSASLGDATFPALPGTASEARALGKILLNAELVVDVEATETALKQASAPRILHIATHGFFLPDQAPQRASESGAGRGLTAVEGVDVSAVENPLLRSGIALAGANGRKSGDEDGILTALEAAGLDLEGTELVVLSACETGLGEVLNGDGVYGLRRALFIAGAKTEITSLWKVDDKATRDLMVDYYQRLYRGGGRSASLHEVQRALLAKSETAHPYYWASFVVSGDASPLKFPGTSAPSVPRVAPGARGCACALGGDGAGDGGGGFVLAIAVGMARRRGGRRR